MRNNAISLAVLSLILEMDTRDCGLRYVLRTQALARFERTAIVQVKCNEDSA
jgi:hypothetical protein